MKAEVCDLLEICDERYSSPRPQRSRSDSVALTWRWLMIDVDDGQFRLEFHAFHPRVAADG